MDRENSWLIIIEFSHRWHENVGGRYQLESRDRVVRKSSSWWSIITGDSWPINSVFALSWQMEQKSEHVGFKVSRCNRNRIEFAVFTLPLNLCVHPPCRCSFFKKILSRITHGRNWKSEFPPFTLYKWDDRYAVYNFVVRFSYIAYYD